MASLRGKKKIEKEGKGKAVSASLRLLVCAGSGLVGRAPLKFWEKSPEFRLHSKFVECRSGMKALVPSCELVDALPLTQDFIRSPREDGGKPHCLVPAYPSPNHPLGCSSSPSSLTHTGALRSSPHPIRSLFTNTL